MTDYQQLLNRLYQVNLFNGVKLGLNNVLTLHKKLNFPANQFKSIHIAGSNGKGSVSTKIAKTLELSGLKVGLYTSPHLSCFRERIQINGKMIKEDDVVKYLRELFSMCEANKIPATFFELTTMIAFQYFAENQVDFAIIETGLGGRLDATNIITPNLSIITSISLDHTDILGDTIDQITQEKAGIIKHQIPILIGPKVSFEIINPIARKNKSPLIQLKEDFIHFEEENKAIATQALKYLSVPDEFIHQGIEIRPKCRMEPVQFQGKTFILDVAHNPDGLKRLFSSIKMQYPDRSLRVIFGLSQNKDIANCLSILKNEGVYFHLVSANNGRGAPVLELKKEFLADKTQVFSHQSVSEAIDQAIKGNELIVICGTFFIMSDARKALGFDEPCDEFDTNEKFVSNQYNSNKKP